MHCESSLLPFWGLLQLTGRQTIPKLQFHSAHQNRQPRQHLPTPSLPHPRSYHRTSPLGTNGTHHPVPAQRPRQPVQGRKHTRLVRQSLQRCPELPVRGEEPDLRGRVDGYHGPGVSDCGYCIGYGDSEGKLCGACDVYVEGDGCSSKADGSVDGGGSGYRGFGAGVGAVRDDPNECECDLGGHIDGCLKIKERVAVTRSTDYE